MAVLFVNHAVGTFCQSHGRSFLTVTWRELFVSYVVGTFCQSLGGNILAVMWPELLVSHLAETFWLSHGGNFWSHFLGEIHLRDRPKLARTKYPVLASFRPISEVNYHKNRILIQTEEQ